MREPELFDPSASPDIQALVAEVRVTPRLVRQFAWGELQAYLALSLRKARTRGPGVRPHIKVGPQELDEALTSVTKVALLKIKGLTFAETGITAGNGTFTLAFNLKVNPLFPLCIETRWAQLITHRHRFPGFDMAMDFEAQFVVEILPSLDTLKYEAGRALYYMQRFVQWVQSGAARAWGRNALRWAIRKLNAAGTRSHHLVARILEGGTRAGARAGNAMLRGIAASTRLIELVELPVGSVLFLADTLSYVGQLHLQADENTIDGYFLGGYVQRFHALATDALPQHAVAYGLLQGTSVESLAGVDFEAKELDPQEALNLVSVEIRRFFPGTMNWPVVVENCRKLYVEAADRGAFGRAAVLRGAIESTLRVAGMAAAFQEFLAFIATQTFLQHEEDTRRGTVLIAERSGYDSWKRLAAVYEAYLLRRWEAAKRPPRPALHVWQTEVGEDAAFLRMVYRETSGFPMLPEMR